MAEVMAPNRHEGHDCPEWQRITHINSERGRREYFDERCRAAFEKRCREVKKVKRMMALGYSRTRIAHDLAKSVEWVGMILAIIVASDNKYTGGTSGSEGSREVKADANTIQ